MEHKWMTCECKCIPECDPVTRSAFCANDTGKPAHCVCNLGLVPMANRNPGDVFKCVNSTSVDAAVTSETTEDNQEKEDKPMDQDVKDRLKLAQIIIIFWVIGWLAAVMIIFLVMCYFKTDRVIQMQEELTLIVVFLLVIAATQRPGDLSDNGVCKIISILLHYFFTCTIVFFCLEALHTYSIVTYMVPNRGYLHTLVNLAIGYGFPIIPLAFSVGFLWDDYGSDIYHCWCRLDTGQAWGFLFPIGFLAFVCTVIAEAQGQGKYKALPDTDHGEYTSAKVSQGSIMIIMPLTLLSYVFGLIAIDLQNQVLWAIFLIIMIFLGPVIFFFHCIGNGKVRAMLARLCPCFPCLKEQEPEKPMERRIPEQAEPLPEKQPEPPANPSEVPEASPRPQPPPSAGPSGPRGIIYKSREGPDTKDTDWQNFHKWVMDGKKDNVSQAENVLFEK